MERPARRGGIRAFGLGCFQKGKRVAVRSWAVKALSAICGAALALACRDARVPADVGDDRQRRRREDKENGGKGFNSSSADDEWGHGSVQGHA
jgi:hypothetical protein